jgi:hypothetical protein
MGFFRSILLLLGAACSVSFAIFAGHALSVHEQRPILIGAGLLVLGALLLAIYAKTGRDAAHHS